MVSVLITAFEPYDQWTENASWLTLVKLTQNRPTAPAITTRRYPVDFQAMRERLANDLRANYDFALHLGQAPGATRIQLEAIGINVAGGRAQSTEQFRPLVEDGPVAYRSGLPLGDWAAKLREHGIPAEVSYHAGTYLCNATLYYSCYLAEQLGLKTKAAFVHLPLDPAQTIAQGPNLASLPSSLSADALHRILAELERGI